MIQNATLRFLRGDHKGVGLRTWTSRFTPLFHFLLNSVSFITWLRWIKFYSTGTGDFNTWLHSNKLFITWNLQICWHICSIWQKQTHFSPCKEICLLLLYWVLRSTETQVPSHHPAHPLFFFLFGELESDCCHEYLSFHK